MASGVSNKYVGHSRVLLVIIDVYPDMIKNTIVNTWPPKTVKTLIQNEEIFMKNLNSHEKSKVLLLHVDGYNNCDGSLLYRIIRYFNLLPNPKRGWENPPLSTDITQSDDLVRMQRYRNNMFHRPRGGISEQEENSFFQENIEIARRSDSMIGFPLNGFETRINSIKCFCVPREKYEKALEKCAEYQATLQKPCVDLYYGNDIAMKMPPYRNVDPNDSSEQRCVLYIRDTDVDVNYILQNIDDIKKAIEEGSYEIKLIAGGYGSLVLQLLINSQCFISKEYLHQALRRFIITLFEVCGIGNAFQDRLEIVLADDECAFLTDAKRERDFQNDNRMPSLQLEVSIPSSVFSDEKNLYREINSFVAGLYSAADARVSTQNGSSKQVIVTGKKTNENITCTSDVILQDCIRDISDTLEKTWKCKCCNQQNTIESNECKYCGGLRYENAKSASDNENVELTGCSVEALYDFYDEDLGEYCLRRGDIISLIQKDNHDWWTGRLGQQKFSFPRHYVRECDQNLNMKYQVIRNYSPCKDDEVKAEAGDIVTMINRRSSMLYVSLREQEGWIPCAFVQHISKEQKQKPAVMPKPTVSKSATEHGKWYVIKSFEPQLENGPNFQIALRRGETIKVIDSSQSKWWYGSKDKIAGWFPKNCVAKPRKKNVSITAAEEDIYEIPELPEIHEGQFAQAPITTSRMSAGSRDEDEVRILLVGKTGTGKSALGNLILGKPFFESKTSGKSVTYLCARGETIVRNRKIIVVDTPGLFDTLLSPTQVKQNISRCVHMLLPGPHVFLLFIQIGRFTKEEIEALNNLFEIFGSEIRNYSILLFTRLDDLEREKRTIESFIQDTGEPLTKYLSMCRGRYFAVNNVAPEEEKDKILENLIDKIDQIIKENRGTFFANEMFAEVKENLEKTIKAATAKVDEERKKSIQRIKTEFENKIRSLREEKADLEEQIRNATCYDDKETYEIIEQLKASKKNNEEIYKIIKQDEVCKISEVQKDFSRRKHKMIMEFHDEIQEDMQDDFLEQLKDIEQKLGDMDREVKYDEEPETLRRRQRKVSREKAKYFEHLEKRSNALEKKLRPNKSLCPIM